VDCRTKSWETAAVVCVWPCRSSRLLCPGQPSALNSGLRSGRRGEQSSGTILFDEQEEEGEEEASSDNVSAKDLVTKFRAGYEMSLNLLWANIKLPASLIMNMEAEKS
ncbi:MAG: hypothetical protein ACKPKO_02115, partial [Candidatus Fonsibacter sp.]